MYLRESRQKRADGSVLTHLQLAENVWDPEQRRARVQIVYNCGRGDDPASTERLRRLARSILRRCAPEEIVAANPDWQVVNAWSYGDLYVLEQLWRRLGLPEVLATVLAGRKFDFDVERALFAMVANRALAPASKLYCYTQWLQEDVRIEGTQALSLQHLYRAMDVLEAQREAIEQALYYRLADLLNLDVELVFYDTTSLHFEVDEADGGCGEHGEVHGSVAAGRKTYQALRKRGHAKNGRSDVPQIVIGLAVTRDGFPVRHWIFPGNTVDVTTVAKVKEDLKGWQLSRCVFVGDAGMVSKANLETLARAGGKYIVCMPIHRGGEVAAEVVTRPGRYQKVADNLEVKEVTVGDGERRRRYVVCYNPQEAERQRRHREQVLAELTAEIEALSTQTGHAHGKRVCELRASGRYGRYLRFTKTGQPRIDATRLAELTKLDGKFVVHSNDDTLTAADLALGYKQLQRVEQAWRTLKSGLRLRPVYHWAPHRIHAHVSLTILALLLERVAEQACGDTWRNIRDDFKRMKLAQLSSTNGTVWQVTEPSPDITKRLKALQIPKPPPILELA
ncbi:MAG: IS1634 family transposase [Sterolibacteriaceae bacterium]|nr:IS1634 family transposase [Sterolibacteriaceae bacterium]